MLELPRRQPPAAAGNRPHAAAAQLFASEAFTQLFAMLERELDDDYLRTVDYHLRELAFAPRRPARAPTSDEATEAPTMFSASLTN